MNPSMNHSTAQRIESSTSHMEMSAHAIKRGHQRAISEPDVRLALIYGQRRWSHGDQCFTLTDRALRDTPYETQCDRLRGLCVVVAGDGMVRTVKWDFEVARRPGVLRRAQRLAA